MLSDERLKELLQIWERYVAEDGGPSSDITAAMRELLAMREAVSPFLDVARAVDPVFIKDDNTVWHAGPSAVVTVGDCRKLLAACGGPQC